MGRVEEIRNLSVTDRKETESLRVEVEEIASGSINKSTIY